MQVTNAARIAAQQATEQQAALRQATEFQSKAIEQQAAVAAASVQEAARRHAESIAQAVAQQQMKLQTALTSSLIQAPPPHAQAPHAPPSFEAPASVAEGEPLDEKERREAERLAYEQREATRREAERKQWEEMERERREAERRAFAEQFESTRREFERQEALRRRELEHELRLQQERLLATLPLGHAVELAAPTAPTVPTSSCALLGQSSADASSVYASGSLGMLGHRQPPAPPPQAVAYNYALSAPGAEAGGASTGAVPGAYAAPPVLMVAQTFGWDSLYMLTNFGWRAAAAVALNAARKHSASGAMPEATSSSRMAAAASPLLHCTKRSLHITSSRVHRKPSSVSF